MQISITSRKDQKTFLAQFDTVRTSGPYELGWSTVEDDGTSLRFPTILRHDGMAYTVYTVSDWQAPDFGDLSDPTDWAALKATGAGEFYNPAASNPRAISTAALDLRA